MDSKDAETKQDSISEQQTVELKEKLGGKFNLKDFHNKFLSYGSSPVPVIRKLMLAELGL